MFFFSEKQQKTTTEMPKTTTNRLFQSNRNANNNGITLNYLNKNSNINFCNNKQQQFTQKRQNSFGNNVNLDYRSPTKQQQRSRTPTFISNNNSSTKPYSAIPFPDNNRRLVSAISTPSLYSTTNNNDNNSTTTIANKNDTNSKKNFFDKKFRQSLLTLTLNKSSKL